MAPQLATSALTHVPTHPIVDFTLTANQAPRAWIAEEHWKTQITTELPWLSGEQLQVVRRGGRAHKLLAIMQLAPSANSLPQGRAGLHSLRLIIYAWINQPCISVDVHIIKWEAELVIYDGPLTMRIKDEQVSKEGVLVEGRPLTWWVYEDGSGVCCFDVKDASGRKRRWIRFVLDELKLHPELVTRLELESTPWKPHFVRSKHGIAQIRV
ncbi:hypothetical protein LTR41_011239 [Exophiala xenobiotica]|nr:hypothetical protein LTR41_011239 [Exophiala xenobiotica]